MKQPKVYIKHLDIVLAVEAINFHEKTVEVYFNDNADNVPFNFDEVEFIENTGFKDKKGNNVYVGDIVELENWFDDKLELRVVNKCEYYHDFYTSIGEEDRAIFDSGDRNYIEVIGNIYENKDLLEN